MLIFLEYSFILKAIYIYILINLVSASLNKFVLGYKVISLSILGGCILSSLSFLNLTTSQNSFVMVLTLGLIVFVVFYPKSFGKFMVILLTTVAYILLKKGFSILLKKILFKFLPLSAGGLVCYYVLEIMLVALFSVVILVSFRVMYQKKLILDFVYDVTIILNNNQMKLKMLLDSGNSLVDDITGLPIIVCSKNVFKVSNENFFNDEEFRKIEYQTLNGYCSCMSIIKPQKIVIQSESGQKEINAMLGVVDKKFKLYDGLLHILTC